MTKKVIILVLITLLVINTIFWLYIGIRVYELMEIDKMWDEVSGLIDRLGENDALTLVKRYFEKRGKITDDFGGSMIVTFKDTYPHTPFIILAITDAVLIAISFMIILLYKKD